MVNDAAPPVSAIFDPTHWDEVPGFDFTDITYHRANDVPAVRIAFDFYDTAPWFEALIGAELKIIVIMLEALLQTPATIEHKSADETTGPVATVTKAFRHGDVDVGQGSATVEAYPVVRRVHASEDRSV